MDSSPDSPKQCQALGGLDSCIAQRRRILYFSPAERGGEDFIEALRHCDRCSLGPGCAHPRVTCDGEEICWVSEQTVEGALSRLGEYYISLVLIDVRWREGGDLEAWIDQVLRLLQQMDTTEDLEQRYGFHRIMVLVSGPDHDRVDRLIAALGAHGVGRVLRQRRQDDPEPAFVGRAMGEVMRMIGDRRSGLRALCAAGGGITGIYYELGALKCINDCIGDGALNRFELYFGISAGAVVTGLLSVGYSVDEIMAAIAGVEGGRIPSLNLALLRTSHLNYRDYVRRVRRASGSVPARVWRLLRSRRREDLSHLLFEYGDVLMPPFHARSFEEVLRQVFSAPGATNSFHHLPRRLFIGASDQDARQHVLFGDGENQDVSISRAIQASLSFNPAFASVPIGGRFYEDGAVTRTTNFAEAIRRGAKLIFLLDPFVPYVSAEPGFAAGQGMLYNVDQNIRTVSYTRFENTRNWVLRRHPDVSAYSFLPANRYRRLMSINPMDHRPFLQIWRSAYLSALKRIKLLRHRMRGDLHVYGLELQTERAEAVAERLTAARELTFSDFFVDGEVAIHKPRLCLQRS